MVDALEQALGGLGVFDDLGVADGIGEQVEGGCRNRLGHGGTSFLWRSLGSWWWFLALVVGCFLPPAHQLRA
nr:MAG TPA: hypothetical protein [Caudoviricetes sp.]